MKIFSGKPKAQEGQGEGWFSLADLQTLDFPEANQAIIAKLVKIKVIDI